MRRGVLRRITRFRGMIIDYNKKAPYFCSGVRCVGRSNYAVCLGTAPRALCTRLGVNGNMHPLLLGGAPRRMRMFVHRRLGRHRPFCRGTGRVVSVGIVSGLSGMGRAMRRIHDLLGMWEGGMDRLGAENNLPFCSLSWARGVVGRAF